VLNAVFVEVPASALAEIAGDPDVLRVAPVGHYELDLSETVPYIGAAAVQAAGIDGTGVTVAVLDSGIDYTHADLGGSGDPADYASNDGTIIEPGTFPTDKVVGGFDFLGNVWPTGPGGFADPPLPDPDPLDDLALVPGAFAGHGTHVADIIAGVDGVAPGASLYGVKVCASMTSSCNGISLILGMEFAVDPNGDGDTSDRVDIINMSLGANYGQPFDDDLSTAVDNASALGTLTVSSAGNCGDLPYCTGTPSSAPTAISVAQTQVPSAQAFQMNVLQPEAAAGLYEAVKYSWTPDPAGLIEGPVLYGDTDGDNLNGCAPFDGDLTGLIVAVDRGACFFSDKIRNIENAGGELGIVMLIDDSAPFAGAFGGGDPIGIPGFNISRVDGNILRAGNAFVQFGPQFSFSLAGSTVSSTARGPDMSFNAIKPEIGAPGASISAEVATGTGRTPFGGTSGASPMVAGSAALLQQACRTNGGNCSPLALKALLMNNGFRDVISDTTGGLAEITRIGGGEVRVDQSAAATFWAYSPDDGQPSLGLGFLDVSKPQIIHRDVEILNLTDRRQTISVTPTFRYADDAAAGAISATPNRDVVTVPGGQSRSVRVKFEIDPANLSGNPMNSGSNGNNPAALSAAEYDGYLLLEADNGDEVALPWHVLPRQAASVQTERRKIVPREFPTPDVIGLNNQGAGTAQNDVYSIIGLSDEMPRGPRGEQRPMPDLRAVGVTTIPVPAGFCSASESFLWVFAINTWDRQSHLVPVSHQISLDTDQDGVDDYLILNRDVTLSNVTDGRQLSWVIDLGTGSAGAFFFAEHATNTGNTALLVCGEQVGLSGPDLLATNVDVTVFAQDFYNGGPGDLIEGITITPLGERFFGVTSDLPAGASGDLEVYDFGAFPGNSEEAGLLLLTNGDRGAGARGGATEDTEALLILAPGVKPPAKLTPPQNGNRKDGRYD
jgi:subtilisin family serine protease